ncbi:MAG: YcaO-like family protein, partial [Candidatus Acidiferrales bacterium]
MAERVGSGQLLPGVDSPGAKEFRQGTHRTVSPAETVARARSLMAAIGITRIANITGLDRIGIPVAVACRPNSRSLAVSQGKGLDPEAARASALMESIELHHAEHIALPVKLGSYEELKKTHSLAEVEKLPRVRGSLFHSGLPLLWVEGFDLLQQQPAWVPFEMVSMNYTLPFPPGSGCFQATSNGLASGNHLLEAVSQGICEVVERDATTLWRLSREASQRARLVDLTTVDDPACREVLEKFERAGVAVAAWDTTTDIGIPAFRCTIAQRRDDPLRPLYTIDGMGCHPSRSIALLRALTEAAQGRLTYIAGSRDDLYRETYELASSPATAQRKR